MMSGHNVILLLTHLSDFRLYLRRPPADDFSSKFNLIVTPNSTTGLHERSAGVKPEDKN